MISPDLLSGSQTKRTIRFLQFHRTSNGKGWGSDRWWRQESTVCILGLVGARLLRRVLWLSPREQHSWLNIPSIYQIFASPSQRSKPPPA